VLLRDFDFRLGCVVHVCVFSDFRAVSFTGVRVVLACLLGRSLAPRKACDLFATTASAYAAHSFLRKHNQQVTPLFPSTLPGHQTPHQKVKSQMPKAQTMQTPVRHCMKHASIPATCAVDVPVHNMTRQILPVLVSSRLVPHQTNCSVSPTPHFSTMSAVDPPQAQAQPHLQPNYRKSCSHRRWSSRPLRVKLQAEGPFFPHRHYFQIEK
jgi:hypothetical protein